ncbi:[FeFe] hydrogenase H-cluster maturation GTPase HydF [Niameybacter massiliensis]|uniref:[FeFe] hydrogenase H-cluster maturation GTPase HydF n=1 Tax=Niameybacter massiliensis TaxID=1658108 RepID=UPI0006B5AF33|nr:[FeFe] hydrogenase H-cluster maturation GTPase HydF [Niameybacter massiliensis]
MQQTPKGNQLHIGLFGKRNAGKSTLMNVLLDQELSIVSPIAGTTTDIVHKSKEWHPLGPIVFVDTPGLDDEGTLGELRIQKAMEMLRQVDLVLWITKEEELEEEEQQVLLQLDQAKTPYLIVYNKYIIEENKGIEIKESITISAKDQIGIDTLKVAITNKLMQMEEPKCIGDKVGVGDRVLLVMPQDLQAPKGRLILPQVQILREILDAHAIPIMTTKETLEETLTSLKEPPDLIITDSQIFSEVYEVCPKSIPLTSFSILMARRKGDLEQYVEGVYALKQLKSGDKVLIAESCSHNPLHGDIARCKIPQAIKKQTQVEIQFENVCGNSFPEDLSAYALVIQCGGCMHTPKQIKTRLKGAKLQQVPITNFGIVLAYLSGILDKVWIP